MQLDSGIDGGGQVSERSKDVTPLPDLVHGVSRSGPVRERRPVYVDLLPPCNAGCPAGEIIQAWLAQTTAGKPVTFGGKWQVLPELFGRFDGIIWQGDRRGGRMVDELERMLEIDLWLRGFSGVSGVRHGV